MKALQDIFPHINNEDRGPMSSTDNSGVDMWNPYVYDQEEWQEELRPRRRPYSTRRLAPGTKEPYYLEGPGLGKSWDYLDNLEIGGKSPRQGPNRWLSSLSTLPVSGEKAFKRGLGEETDPAEEIRQLKQGRGEENESKEELTGDIKEKAQKTEP
ncbi:hypothetical protein H072_2161 [Dactylellina haptotyla CBS 200.50]|uniref:Uncharacterized protein n=1 Tax=Dactylellina haptotyla (strain CBS 200.50) TaxID=1284197 RepID=S8AS44_DACHA|nr:hypothetical protein H072_2161 [Dactylellina haptotyla CBS 200.50]